MEWRTDKTRLSTPIEVPGTAPKPPLEEGKGNELHRRNFSDVITPTHYRETHTRLQQPPPSPRECVEGSHVEPNLPTSASLYCPARQPNDRAVERFGLYRQMSP